MGYVSITTAIANVLNNISGIQAVYPYEPKELKEYPAATITALSHTNAFETIGPGGSNKRVYQHKIVLYYRTDVAQDAESILQALADAVITAIEHDTTLGAAVDIAQPSTGKWAYQQRELPVRLVEITISSMQVVGR